MSYPLVQQLLLTLVLCTTLAADTQNESTVKIPQTQPAVVTQEKIYSQLETVCKTFNVPLENCTCDLFQMGSGGKKLTFCEVEKELEVPIKTVEYKPELSVTVATFATIMSVAGIFGNAAVIVVAHRNKDVSNFQYLIKILAVSDLIFSFMQLILSVPLFWTNRWLYGSLMCKGLRGGKIMGDLLYVGFLLVMAVERYFTIIKSSKKVTKTMLSIGVIVNIVVAMITALPLPIIYKVDDLGMCVEGWADVRNDSLTYNCFLLAFYVLTPGLILTVLCYKIYEKLNLQSKLSKIDVTALHLSIDRKLSENQRTMKMIFSMLVAFIFCTLPNRVGWIYLSKVNYQMHEQEYMILAFIALLTYPLLVCINPIIYSVIDRTWRKNMINVILFRKIKTPYATDDQGFTTSKKTFDATTLPNMNANKTEKKRNLSIDQGTHLLSYNPSYFTMPTSKVSENAHTETK